ncbi:YgaP family membrane protein [Oscillatoria salina]|uniref:YgaP family membrane protein n=1 Tax=Oscillatoria salina TaxID=331517 RepID=UPI0013B6C058|nr:DUF2892 domain-containing protein [Oscillatoria salina]MBZ8180286.1 DUF2892 domain-containing protein [Oscillatoria salina IIICB1]NET87752.1 DUF2892 domain-containing protein [Kamptonema sp. SIO1D9]
MFRNVGSLDRIMRLILAAALLYAGLNIYRDTALGIGLDIASALFIFSAAIGFCGIYRLLGIRTNKSQNPQ